MSHSGGETSVEWLITYYESFKTLCYFSEIIDEKRVLEKLCEKKIVKNCVIFWRKIMVRITEDLIRKRAEHNELMVRNTLLWNLYRNLKEAHLRNL